MKERRGSVYQTKVRLIEADRVASPDSGYSRTRNGNGKTIDGAEKIYGGVELTTDGEVDAYWLSPRHPGSVVGMTYES